MNYEKITTCDVCNGEGVGVVLWVSGCDMQCKGCHNKETWDPASGKEFTDEVKKGLLKELDSIYIERFTLSGGHPLMPCNRKAVKQLINEVRNRRPEIAIWLYTGYIYENMSPECKEICHMCDYIVDGPYIEELKDLSLPFRGSSNQRIICMHNKQLV